MKVNSLFILSTALLFAGCVNEIVSNEQNGQEPQVNLVPVTFQAGSEEDSDADTKVTLGGVDNKSVLWTEADQIKVFDKTENDLPAFTVSSGAGTTFAAISGSVSAGATGNFYAMYPYQADATFTSATTLGSDTDPSVTDGYITLEVPAEQKAVAGSLDPAAFIGVGQCKDGTKFNFKNATAFVKFQLNSADIENLETVSFSGNSLGTVAGKIKIGFTESGSVAQTYVSGAGAQYITLSKPDGGWESGVDYYFAIRPLKFADGFTITARYTDNSCRHLTTTKGVTNANGEAQTISRNCTMNLGTLPPMKAGLPNDLYIAYLHGQDIDIAGTKVNKTTHGAPRLLSDVSKNITYQQGITFLDCDDTKAFTLGARLDISDNSYFIGRRDTVTIKPGTYEFTHRKGTLAFKNINFDLSQKTSNQFISNYGASNDVDNFIIDGCNVTGLQVAFYSLSGNASYKDYTCKNFIIHNSSFTIGTTVTTVEESVQEVAATIDNGILSMKNSTSTNINNIDVKNCIFHCTKNTTARLIYMPTALKEYNERVSFTNNTVFNIHAGSNKGLLHLIGGQSIIMQNNIFSFYGLSSGEKEYIIYNTQDTNNIAANNNYYQKRSTTDDKAMFLYKDLDVEFTTTGTICKNSYPYASSYEGVGATR